MTQTIAPLRMVIFFAQLAFCTLPLQAQAEYGTKFLPPEATAAAIIKPGQWLQHPMLKLMPTELMSVESERIFGLVPEDVASLLIFGGLPDVEGNPRLGMVVRTTGPYDLSKILPQPQQDGALVPRQFEGTGVEYLHSKSPQLVSVYPVDETTLIFALPGTLEPMLQRIDQEPEGMLAERIHSGRTEAALQVYVVAEPVREMARFLLSSPRLPQPLSQLADVPDQLQYLEFYADMWPNPEGVTLLLTGRDEAAAEKLETTVARLLDFGSAFAASAAQPRDPDNPHQQALAQYQARITTMLRTVLQPTREGQRVTVTTVGKEEIPPQLLIAGGMGLVLPALADAQLRAFNLTSMNNMKQILLAMHNYYDTHQHMPPQASRDADGRPLLSWRVHVLPYVDQMELYEKFRLDEPWDSEHNLPLSRNVPQPFVSRANPELAKEGKTRFQLPLGEGLPASVDEKLTFRLITDGTSNTVAVVEAPADRAVIWSKPDDLDIDLEDPLRSLVGELGNDFLGAMYDGSVHSFQKSLGNETIRKILTHAGGEVFGRDELQ